MDEDSRPTGAPGDATWKKHTSGFDRVQSVALTLTEPRTAGWIADEALVAENTARRHLQRLVDLNILTAATDSDAVTYYPDPVYVRTREVRALIGEYDQDGLTALAADLKADIETWREEYDTAGPETLRQQAVDGTVSANEARERRQIASDWEHTRYRLSLIEDALDRYGEFTSRPAPA
ncbi:ArsR family transcriptional regulator [Halosimplex rubrum]|uniref:ArsR family transcriptional regulator n=1 Tax=Halosimplex rubrum TaxID=869889 RepID=A0A7D5SPP4_9EURY|nr:ArsR family transcriptional regulator [Halosimplex rubrum]QLH76907.1 ArsR family transcriptional regulator [Halosimplex rubrum]